ncbi:MAG: hypothetical protein O2782_14385, partial [bacterium]|nr:hypothetical protein [bacterium]
MRIESSTITLASQHASTQTHTRQETLTAGIVTGAWSDDISAAHAQDVRQQERTLTTAGATSTRSLLEEYLGPLMAGAARQRASQPTQAIRQTTSPTPADLRQTLDAMGSGTATPSGSQLMQQVLSSLQLGGMGLLGQINGLSLDDMGTSALAEGQAQVQTPAADQLKMDLIRTTVEAFTGRKPQLLHLADLELGGSASAARGDASQAPDKGDEAAAAEPEKRFGLRYTLHETRTERETTSFQARGVVHTADGRAIDIDVSLTMDRQFVQETSAEVRVGAALQDPLVVNFGGTAAELTQRTFAFDLDANGAAEQIHFVRPGSGFLAWDRNGSGTVDDGSELFGPATGQGFTELAAHDDDGNGFIDEGDGIYGQLRIWEKNETGTDRLV